MEDIMIIGGGTAGLTAAIYAARAGKTVRVIERATFGGQITSSPRVENYPGFVAVSGNEFAEKLLDQVLALDVETSFCEVNAIEKKGGYFTVRTDDGDFDARAVILATGARHRALGLRNEEELVGAGVSYCAVCDGSFYRGKNVAVVGGGSAALQQTLYLAGVANKVTLIHRRAEFRGETRLAALLQSTPNAVIMTDTVVTELTADGDGLTAIVLKNVLTDEASTLPVDGLFIAVGQVADNEPFRSLVKTDDSGFILAGEDCLTSCEGVFAAGDCRVKTVRQLTTAAGDGAVAATAAAAYVDGLRRG